MAILQNINAKIVLIKFDEIQFLRFPRLHILLVLGMTDVRMVDFFAFI